MRSLFLPLPLLLAPLSAPLLFVSPAGAVQMLPPCCQREGETHPPDPHTPGSPFVGAEVKRRDERALEAGAEAPTPADALLPDAIGIPLDPVAEDRRGVSEPRVVPVPMLSSELQALQGEDVDVEGPPCCRAAGETHPPDRHPEDQPPVLVGAKVENRVERALTMLAELPIPAETPLVSAIGVPLDAQRGVSEPASTPAPVAQRVGVDDHGEPCCTAPEPEDPSHTPVTADAPRRWLDALKANAEAVVLALLLVLAIGITLRWPRSRAPRLDDQPAPPRGLPDELPRPDMAPVPVLEPEVAQARARRREAERESA